MHKNGTANIEMALKFIEAENKNDTDQRTIMEKSKRVMNYCNENRKPYRLYSKRKLITRFFYR